MNQIIVITPARLGDAVFCTPVIRVVRCKFPNAIIDVLAITKLAGDVFEHNPNVNTVFVSPPLDAIKKIAAQYDRVIDVHPSKNTTPYTDCFEKEKILTIHHENEKNQHASEHRVLFYANELGVDLTNFNFNYDLYPQKENIGRVTLLLSKSGVGFKKDILIGFHLGCHGLSKKRSRIFNKLSHPKAWHIKKYIKLAKRLQKHNNNIRIVLTGSKEELLLEKLFCKKIKKTISCINKLSILDNAALMSFLKLFVSNDTGMIHVACATTVPVLGLYGGNSNVNAVGVYPKTKTRMLLYAKNVNRHKINTVFDTTIKLLAQTEKESHE